METSPRPTRSITTTGGHVVVFRSYATGREKNEIEAMYMVATKYSMDGTSPKLEGFDPNIMSQAAEKSISLLVVSLDGATEDLTNRVLDLPSDDYDEIVAALEQVTGKKKSE